MHLIQAEGKTIILKNKGRSQSKPKKQIGEFLFLQKEIQEDEEKSPL